MEADHSEACATFMKETDSHENSAFYRGCNIYRGTPMKQVPGKHYLYGVKGK